MVHVGFRRVEVQKPVARLRKHRPMPQLLLNASSECGWPKGGTEHKAVLKPSVSSKYSQFVASRRRVTLRFRSIGEIEGPRAMSAVARYVDDRSGAVTSWCVGRGPPT